MKKILKVLAATAALAAVVPFHSEGDKNKGTIEALIWKAKWDIDPDYQTQSDIHVLLGFNNPFKKKNHEAELFADELVVDYCCDSTLAHDCVHSDCCCDAPDEEYDDVDASTKEEPCTCGDQCGDCGDDCTCTE